MPENPVKKVETIIISSLILIVIVCGIFCFALGYRRLYFLFVTFLMVLYHILMRASVPRVLSIVHRGPFNPDNLWFRTKSFEKAIYKFFQVKKWKDSLITYEPESFSLRTSSPERILQSMCIAETIHFSLICGSLIYILFGFIFGKLWIFILTGTISIIFECRFIMAQRYNRPRVKELIRKRSIRK